MKKTITLLLCGILAGGVLSGCGSKAASETKVQTASETKAEAQSMGNGELNLFTWDGMFPQEVLDGFEKETGIRIYYSNFDTDEDMLAKLEETKGGDYDLVIADDYIIEVAIEQNLVQKLQQDKLSNFSNINPLYQSQFYDEANEYTIPHGAGIPLIVYHPEETGFELKSYGDLWDPRLEGNVALVGNYRVINGITLKSMGESFNTTDLEVIQRAGDKLLELAPNVRVINDSNTQDFLVSGEASAAFLYTSQAILALDANPDLKVAYPEEGLGFGIMAGFIPVKAPNPEGAHLFLDYVMRPEVAAKCFEYTGYYCTNKAAEAYISEGMKEKIVVPQSVQDGEIIQNVTQEAEDLHGKIWNEFKNACN